MPVCTRYHLGMETPRFNAFKEPGIADGATVKIIEEESKLDVELLGEARKFRDESYKVPEQFVVKRIINRGGVETAVLVDGAHAAISQDEIQRTISRQRSFTEVRDWSDLVPPEVARQLSQPREAESPMRRVMFGEIIDGVMIYYCPTWYLEPAKNVMSADEFAQRRARRDQQGS